MIVLCAECLQPAQLVTGEAVYPHRPDLHAKKFYRCDCGAYVGCHPGTVQPLGSPAGPDTRRARSEAHAAFDPLWKGKRLARSKAYAWLSDALGIPPHRTHIGMMDAVTARRVVEVCAERRSAAA